MPRLLAIDEHDAGLSWIVDEPMQRASHALTADGAVWLVDPVDVAEPMERALALGRPAGVLQLLDRHNRDCAAVAQRLGVQHLRLPAAIPGAPFVPVKVLDLPGWREVALWWSGRRALVVSEAIGTGPMFRPSDDVPAGVHVFLRPHPPGVLRRYEPDHLLVGHGRPIHGPGATTALRDAYRRTWRDLPGTAVRIVRSLRGQDR